MYVRLIIIAVKRSRTTFGWGGKFLHANRDRKHTEGEKERGIRREAVTERDKAGERRDVSATICRYHTDNVRHHFCLRKERGHEVLLLVKLAD